MPRKKPASYRPTVHNLGSPQGGLLDFNREETYARMNPSLGRKAAALPVYLVNPAQMDRLYPPERRRTFCNPERVREALRKEDRGLLWEALRDDSDCDLFRRTVAAGLYMGSLDGVSKGSVLRLGDPGHQDPGAPPAFQADPGPAIFLCPERIVDWGTREGVPTALVQDKVYYHELAHALMDTAADTASDPYREPWGLVVEESLANWVAASRFQGSEALAVHRLIKGQPPEYLGYEAVSRLAFFSPRWLRYPIFWEDIPWLIRRGYWPPFLPLPLSEKEGLARLNLEVWRETKRRGNQQDPRVKNLWEEFALRLLEEGVF
jgi:hypothetical protein